MTKIIILLAIYSVSVEREIFIPEVSDLPLQESGLASWYGSGINNDNGLHGKITATGEVFDPSKRTCASRTIPLNTIVLVELKRDPTRRVFCRVNDRGPYGALNEDNEWVLKLRKEDPGEWRGVMDLSKGTAKALGFSFNSGLEEINIRYIK